MPRVAASERGGAQTGIVAEAAADAMPGLNGPDGARGRGLAWRAAISRTPLERVTGAGDSPVGDDGWTWVIRLREYRRTRDIRWEAGATTPQG